MNNEQRAKVASEVTGRITNTINSPTGSSIALMPAWKPWNPSFNNGPHNRSQAFAMVEWLSHYIDLKDWYKVGNAIKGKNIDALHQMIWELIDE